MGTAVKLISLSQCSIRKGAQEPMKMCSIDFLNIPIS